MFRLCRLVATNKKVCLKISTIINESSLFRMNSSSLGNSKLRVYVTQPIPKQALDVLHDAGLDVIVNERMPLDRETLVASVDGVDAIFCTLNEKINKELLDKAGDKLKIVATCSVGTDHVDIPMCYSRNVKVGFTPGVLTDTTAEFAMALLLTTTRRIRDGLVAAKNGEWSTWKIMWMCGKGLKGSTIGILGMGRIGLAIANRLKGFQVDKIIYHNRNRSADAEQNGYNLVSFDELLMKSDFLICCAAATEQTFKIFNKNAFNKMKSDSVFVNISRGTLVDQDDLYDALSSKLIGYAALDVTTPEPLPLNHKLFTLDNCLITPHICSAESSTRILMSVITCKNIVNGLNGLPLISEVPH